MSTLVDQYGKEIKSGKPILQQIAVQSIRDRYASYPSQGLTPQRIAEILEEADQGYILRQAELAEEIEEKDGHLGSVLQSRKLAVSGLSWEVLPASASAEDKKIAEAAQLMIEYIGSSAPMECDGWEGGLIDLLDAIFKSFSALEIMWEISEGQVWIKSLDWIHQKRFTFSGPQQRAGDQTIWPLLNVPRLLTDDNPIWGEELLPNKFIFHRHKARSGATSRGGLFRACVYMYLFKNYDIKDWLVFNDLFSVPMRVGKYKQGASPDDIDKLKQAVFNLGVDAAAVISDSTIIELLEAATRTNAGGFKELAEFCEKTHTKVVLGHSSSSDSTPGKLGNEKQGEDLRQDLLESDAKQLERVVRLQILGPWKTYNYGPKPAIPKLKLHYEADEDLEALAGTYGKLVTEVGFSGIPVAHVHERFAIPVAKDGEETIKPPAPVSPFGLAPSAPDAARGRGGDGEIKKNKACGCGAQHHGITAAASIQAMNRLNAKTAAANGHTTGKHAAHGDEFQIMLNSLAGNDASWIAEYMKRISPELTNAKESALAEIRTWLSSLDSAPDPLAFDSKIKQILGDAYSQIDPAAVKSAVNDIYSFYRVEQPIAAVGAAFGGADLRAMDFLANVDHMFYSKFIDNPDAQSAVTDFLSERYLKGGEGLFGRGNPETALEFQNLLAQKMTDISAYQANRIAETSVVRVRNWSHLNQLNEVGITEMEIVEPTQECPFCIAMNGQVIDVPTAAATMDGMTGMSDAEALAWYRDGANAATLENIGSFISRGIPPPYHPHCHGTVVKRVRG